jgi:hypothetical protein
MHIVAQEAPETLKHDMHFILNMSSRTAGAQPITPRRITDAMKLSALTLWSLPAFLWLPQAVAATR